MMPDVVHTIDDLRALVAARGPLKPRFDGGRMPLTDAQYRIVGWLGSGLTSTDLDDVNSAYQAPKP